MKYLLFSFAIFFLSPPLRAQIPVVLSPGETKKILSKKNEAISIEKAKVLGIADLGSHVQLIAKRKGQSLLKLGPKEFQVIVVPGSLKQKILKISTLLDGKKGLKLDVDEQFKPIVKGKLLRLSDWQALRQLSLNQKISYNFEATIPNSLIGNVTKWITPILLQNGIAENSLSLTPYPRVQLDGSFRKNIEHYQSAISPLGLQINIEPGQISQKPSVMLSLVLAEVDQTFEQEMGILWGSADGHGIYKTTVLPTYSPGELFAKLTLLESSGNGKILARPQLLSRSGEKAEFHAGGEIPIQVSGWGSQDVQWKKYGIIMSFQPLADIHGRMSLTVDSEVSIPNISQTAGQLPIFEVNRVKSHFDLDKSRTVVISGLVRNSENHFRQGIPWLSRIPVLGRLFGSPKYQSRKTELLIFVTPKVLRPRELESTAHDS